MKGTPKPLPWTRFNWAAISTRPDGSRMMLYATTQFPSRLSETNLRCRVLGLAAAQSQRMEVGWDPFNVEVIIKPSV